jgi:predicted enzyme related to lactoylglutathione lyase
MRATVGHFEILARDPERLARFFREALSWTAEPQPWDGPAYLKLRPAPGTVPPSRPVGGGILGDEADQAPLLVFHLEEGTLEEALARIEAAGGAVEAPPDAVGRMGRFARFRDPDGRDYGLWEGQTAG